MKGCVLTTDLIFRNYNIAVIIPSDFHNIFLKFQAIVRHWNRQPTAVKHRGVIRVQHNIFRFIRFAVGRLPFFLRRRTYCFYLSAFFADIFCSARKFIGKRKVVLFPAAIQKRRAGFIEHFTKHQRRQCVHTAPVRMRSVNRIIRQMILIKVYHLAISAFDNTSNYCIVFFNIDPTVIFRENKRRLFGHIGWTKRAAEYFGVRIIVSQLFKHFIIRRFKNGCPHSAAKIRTVPLCSFCASCPVVCTEINNNHIRLYRTDMQPICPFVTASWREQRIPVRQFGYTAARPGTVYKQLTTAAAYNLPPPGIIHIRYTGFLIVLTCKEQIVSFRIIAFKRA